MTDIERLKKMIEEEENIVFFGGAGVSTGSGIPDFRGNQGLYQTEAEEQDAPETILSGDYLEQKPQAFYAYYKKNMLYPDAKPNDAHLALAKLEAQGKLTAVITQNIDGLHQLAGSEEVIELHGSVLRNYCTHCFKKFPLSYIVEAQDVPRCDVCGEVVRPDVVLYSENLDFANIRRAAKAIYEADVLIVGGTSLTVNPAASLIRYFSGDHLIIINKSPTPYDQYAEMVIREPIEEVLKKVTE